MRIELCHICLVITTRIILITKYSVSTNGALPCFFLCVDAMIMTRSYKPVPTRTYLVVALHTNMHCDNDKCQLGLLLLVTHPHPPK